MASRTGSVAGEVRVEDILSAPSAFAPITATGFMLSVPQKATPGLNKKWEDSDGGAIENSIPRLTHEDKSSCSAIKY